MWQTAREQAMRKGPLALGKPWESEVPEGAWGGRGAAGRTLNVPQDVLPSSQGLGIQCIECPGHKM